MAAACVTGWVAVAAACVTGLVAVAAACVTGWVAVAAACVTGLVAVAAACVTGWVAVATASVTGFAACVTGAVAGANGEVTGASGSSGPSARDVPLMPAIDAADRVRAAVTATLRRPPGDVLANAARACIENPSLLRGRVRYPISHPPNGYAW